MEPCFQGKWPVVSIWHDLLGQITALEPEIFLYSAHSQGRLTAACIACTVKKVRRYCCLAHCPLVHVLTICCLLFTNNVVCKDWIWPKKKKKKKRKIGMSLEKTENSKNLELNFVSNSRLDNPIIKTCMHFYMIFVLLHLLLCDFLSVLPSLTTQSNHWTNI